MSTSDGPAVPDALDRLGLRVVPMGAEVAPALVRFHDSLSAATTRSRFFSVHPHLSAGEVTRFTTVDHREREALVVLDTDDEIVAVARVDVLPGSPPLAEVAFVVADAWRHHGIGGAVLARLAGRARQVGIEQFVAVTLADNRAMRAVFRRAGDPIDEHVAGGVATVTIPHTTR